MRAICSKCGEDGTVGGGLYRSDVYGEDNPLYKHLDRDDCLEILRKKLFIPYFSDRDSVNSYWKNVQQPGVEIAHWQSRAGAAERTARKAGETIDNQRDKINAMRNEQVLDRTHMQEKVALWGVERIDFERRLRILRNNGRKIKTINIDESIMGTDPEKAFDVIKEEFEKVASDHDLDSTEGRSNFIGDVAERAFKYLLTQPPKSWRELILASMAFATGLGVRELILRFIGA